jgi:arylsulfatase A-like enzyme
MTALATMPRRTAQSALRAPLLGLVVMGLAAGCSARTGDPPETIVLITLDTTRADHLGCYGYPRPTSPNIDEFAASAVVYDRALAPATWTLPSHASLFTGKFVSSHGAQYDANGSLRLTSAIAGPESWNTFSVRTISPAERLLAELLQGAGYRTGAVVAGPWLKRVFGLDKGFDFFDEDNITTENGRRADDVTNRALAWLGETPRGRRFLFLNYFDPHVPFVPPDGFADRFSVEEVARVDRRTEEAARKIVLYDAEIAFVDHHLGRLFAGLRAQDLYDGALIVLTADHGELLGEHGIAGHGNAPYQEVVHIPFIVKEAGTDAPTGRTDRRIQLVDVLPLILDRAGVPIPADIQGAVPPDIQQGAVAPEIQRPVLIESRTLPRLGGEWIVWMDQDRKFIWHSGGRHMLFDLDVDPDEEHNLAGARPDEATTMSAALRQYIADLPEPGPQAPHQEVDEETAEALKALGYLE